MNALGYNPLDNYIYGLQNRTLVRLGRDSSLQHVATVHAAANAGDIDSSGQFYYSVGGKAWGQVDLKPGSTTYGQLVSKGVSKSRALPRGVSATDWASVPSVPGYLYSVGIDTRGVVYLMRWDVSTHTWEVSHKGVPSFGIRGSVFGAVVATRDGVLYASHNGSGTILRIPLSDPAGATKSAGGAKANTSDGCRCASLPDEAV
jgi:hypothetical protein